MTTYTPEERLAQVAASTTLSRIEQLVLTLRFTIVEGSQDHYVANVARKLEVSRAEVRKLETKALHKLIGEYQLEEE